MKYKIEVRNIQSDHILASPEFSRYTRDVDSWIKNNLKDDYGRSFKEATSKQKNLFGIDYISQTGSLILHKYKEPKFNR